MIEQVEALATQGLDAQQVATRLGITRRHLRKKLRMLGADELNRRLKPPPRDPEIAKRQAKVAMEASRAARQSKVAETHEALVEDVEWLISWREHPERIAKRVDRSVITLYELFHDKLDRPDLAAYFTRRK